MTEMFGLVNEYMDKSVIEFMIYIMQHWAIEQHYFTAVSKMMQGRDGFFFDIVDNKYIKKHDYGVAFQDIRMQQLAQVMRDLDML